MKLHFPTCAVALSQHSVGSQIVDHCNTCNGAWFESSELSAILRETTGIDSADRASVDSPETIACPKCEIEIASTIYAHDSGIPILKCSSCSGVWLVAGQLEKILDYRNGPHKTDGLVQAVVESNARSKVLNRFSDVVQSRILSIFFAVAILAVAVFLGVDFPGIWRCFVFLIFPVACIWFSDAMGNWTGRSITHSTPGIAVALGGWILMFAAFGVVIFGMTGG